MKSFKSVSFMAPEKFAMDRAGKMYGGVLQPNVKIYSASSSLHILKSTCSGPGRRFAKSSHFQLQLCNRFVCFRSAAVYDHKPSHASPSLCDAQSCADYASRISCQKIQSERLNCTADDYGNCFCAYSTSLCEPSLSHSATLYRYQHVFPEQWRGLGLL